MTSKDGYSVQYSLLWGSLRLTPMINVPMVHMLRLFLVQSPLLLEPLPHREDQVLVVVAVVEPLLGHPLFCGQSSHA